MDERDFLDLFIDDEARNWQKRQIASRFGWLADWDADYDSGWVMKNHRFILRFWIAFDPETRREYLEFKRNPEKRREYDAESLLESRWEREFFEKWRDKVRARGERAFEQKAAALYFAFEPGVLAWFRDVWLSEEGYEYDSERDDRFLALILLDCDKRVKAPGIVETAFVQWVLPFVASITFLRAKGLGYNL
ncbi:MAG: hypothetical protein IKY61_00650, partial [Thermoguttaceae bacterium]|nr:hypothetical protein [Thermoguttaceae bacterium]